MKDEIRERIKSAVKMNGANIKDFIKLKKGQEIVATTPRSAKIIMMEAKKHEMEIERIEDPDIPRHFIMFRIKK